MTTPFNAQDFRHLIGRHPGSSSYYVVRFFGIPKILEEDMVLGDVQDARPDYASMMFQNLEFLAKQAELPSRQIDTQERRYNGPMKAVPIGHTYTTINIDFLEDQFMQTRKIFSRWQEQVFRQTNGYRVPYYDDIVIDMAIDLYDKDGQRVRTYNIYEAFPITITSTQVGWNMINQGMTTSIEFQFHRWELDNTLEPDPFYVNPVASEKNAMAEFEEIRKKMDAIRFRTLELAGFSKLKHAQAFGQSIKEKVEENQITKGLKQAQQFGKTVKEKAEEVKESQILKQINKGMDMVQTAVDTVRTVKNSVDFARNSIQQARQIAKSVRDLKIKTGSLKEFARSVSNVGSTARSAVNKVNNFGSGVQTIQKKFSSFTINRFLD